MSQPICLPVLFPALIEDSETLESLPKESLMAIVKSLHEENKSLKSLLIEKERDLKLNFNSYQSMAAQFYNLKKKIRSDENELNEKSEKPATKKKKRPIAKAKKRPRPESPEKPPKKVPKILPPSQKHFKCTIKNCQSEFTSETIEEYRLHVKNTHAERTFFCDWCPFTAETDDIFQRHCKELNHIGEYCGCKLCDISFIGKKARDHCISHLLLFHKP